MALMGMASKSHTEDLNQLLFPIHTRVILRPESSPAINSCKAIENRVPVSFLDGSAVEGFSSPDNRPDEDAEVPIVFLVRPKKIPREKFSTFTIGSDPKATLRLSGDDKSCWVNINYCRIYSSSKNDLMHLSNESPLTFAIRDIKSGMERSVYSGTTVLMRPGLWALNLGEGFDFIAKFLPRRLFGSDGCTGSLLLSTSGTRYLRASSRHTNTTWCHKSIASGTKKSGRLKTVDAGTSLHQTITTTSREATALQTTNHIITTISECHESKALRTENGNSSKTLESRASSITKSVADTITASSDPYMLLPHGTKTLKPRDLWCREYTTETAARVEHVIKRNKNTGVTATRVTEYGKVFLEKRWHILNEGTGFRQTTTAQMIRARAQWENELNFLNRLKHENIVKLLNCSPSYRVLQLEYISGEGIHSRVDENQVSTLTANEQHSIWSKISGAISYIHDQGILHNDIKPDNILLSTDSRGAILCDFDVAQAASCPSTAGTAAYMEQEFLYTHWTERSYPSDMWAFGVTMLFVLGSIPLPTKSWVIADIKTSGSDAQRDFKAWLQKLWKTMDGLPQHPTYTLLKRMLDDRSRRIKARELTEVVKTLAEKPQYAMLCV